MIGRALTASLAIALGLACAGPEGEVTLRGNVVTAELDLELVRVVLRELGQAYSSQDLDAVGRLFADRIVHLPPGEPAVVGWEAVHARDSAYLSDYDAELATTVEEVELAGIQAVVRYSYAESRTPSAGGDTTRVTGKGVAVLTKAVGGVWQINLLVWNSNGDG